MAVSSLRSLDQVSKLNSGAVEREEEEHMGGDVRPSPKRTITLPFAFGDIVYYRGRPARVPGVVIGFVIIAMGMKTLVRWTDNMDQVEHSFHELTTEFEPDLLSES